MAGKLLPGICRCDEALPGHYGPVTCCRYWLAPESRQGARKLLGMQEASAARETLHNALQGAA